MIGIHQIDGKLPNYACMKIAGFALITTIFITPIGKVSERLVDKIFEDKELLELEKEGKKLQNEKLRIEIEELKQRTQKNAEHSDC